MLCFICASPYMQPPNPSWLPMFIHLPFNINKWTQSCGWTSWVNGSLQTFPSDHRIAGRADAEINRTLKISSGRGSRCFRKARNKTWLGKSRDLTELWIDWRRMFLFFIWMARKMGFNSTINESMMDISSLDTWRKKNHSSFAPHMDMFFPGRGTHRKAQQCFFTDQNGIAATIPEDFIDGSTTFAKCQEQFPMTH